MKATWTIALALGACTTEPPIPNVPHSTCPQTAELFAHAVCACEDLTSVGELHVRKGPAGIGSLGVNGAVELVSNAEIAGTVYAWGGFSSVGATVGDGLVTPGNVELVGDVAIGGDAVIGGDLGVTGSLAIRGALALHGSESIVGDSAIARREAYVAPAAPPCGCEDQRFFDVAGAVALAKQQLGAATEWAHTGTTELHLATGSYYVTAADLVGDSTIVADGKVSVFVEGSLATVGASRWQVARGAQLDLFVSGNVTSVGDLVAGDPDQPGAFRLYVGGDRDTTVDAVGTTAFHGALYAPRASVNYVGDAVVVGSIFARTITGVGTLTIEYGAPLEPPSSCRIDAPALAATTVTTEAM